MTRRLTQLDVRFATASRILNARVCAPVLFLIFALVTPATALAASKQGVSVGVNMTVGSRGSAPEIVATTPVDGSTVLTATPQFQFVFSIDMNTNITDPALVLLPAGLTVTALTWSDARTLNIAYSGSLPQFGAKRVALFDNVFRTPGNVPIPKGSGLAFNYGDIPPVFTIAPTFSPALPTTSDMVTFSCLANSPVGATLTYSWDFGDGTFGSGATVQHNYPTPNAYLATITVTDGFGGELMLPMLVKVSQGAAVLPPTILPWTVTRASINLNFKKAGRDRIQVLGTVTLPAGYNPLKQTVQVTVGNVSASFTMDKNGRAKTGPNRFSLIRKLKRKVFLGGPVRINFFLHGDFAKALAASGLTNVATPKVGAMTSLPITLTLSSQLYIDQPSVLYKVSRNILNGNARFVLKRK